MYQKINSRVADPVTGKRLRARATKRGPVSRVSFGTFVLAAFLGWKAFQLMGRSLFGRRRRQEQQQQQEEGQLVAWESDEEEQPLPPLVRTASLFMSDSSIRRLRIFRLQLRALVCKSHAADCLEWLQYTSLCIAPKNAPCLHHACLKLLCPAAACTRIKPPISDPQHSSLTHPSHPSRHPHAPRSAPSRRCYNAPSPA